MNPCEIPGDRRRENAEHRLGDVGERRAGPGAVETAVQQLDADLKAPLPGPAAQQIERVLEISRAGDEAVEVFGERGARRELSEKIGAQHRVEQGRAPGQALGQQRCLGHDVGDKTQQSRIGVEQREHLDPGRQAREEFAEAPERDIGGGGIAENPQQSGDQLGEDFACPLAARRPHPAVVPIAHHAGDRARIGKSHLRQGCQGRRVVVAAGKDQVAGSGEARRLLEKLGVVRLDGSEALDEFAGEGLGAWVAEKDGEAGNALVIAGQAMGLGVVDHLQAVFDAAQETVIAGQRRAGFDVDLPGGGEPAQRLAGRGDAQGRAAAAPDQLLRLGEKLDLADAAAPDLDIVTVNGDSTAAAIGLNLALDRMDVGDRREVEVLAPNIGRELGEKARAGDAVARDGAGFYQRRALPILPGAFVIAECRGGRHRQRSRARIGPQPQIGAKNIAIAGPLVENTHEFPGDPVRQGMEGIARNRRCPRRVVEQDEVDITRVIELAAAQLAHAEHDQAAVLNGGRIGRDEAVRRGVAQHMMQRRVERRLGEAGQGLHLAFEIPGAGQVGGRDGQRHPAPGDAQAPHQRRVSFEFRRRLARFGDEFLERRIGARFDEAGQERPFADRDTGQERAVAEHRREEPAPRGRIAPRARGGGVGRLAQRLPARPPRPVRAAVGRRAAAARRGQGRKAITVSPRGSGARRDTRPPPGSGQDRAGAAVARVRRRIRPQRPSRTPAQHVGHHAHRVLVWLGGVLAVLILIAGAGIWRLLQGPVELDRLIPYVQQALSRSGSGVDIAVSGVSIAIDRQTHQLDLRVNDVSLVLPGGEKLASFPEMATSFSLGGLLGGRIEPTRLTIERPVLLLTRDPSGALSFRVGEAGDAGRDVGLDNPLAIFAPPREGAPWSQLRQVTIRDATIIVDDRQTGRVWQANRVAATLERSEAGVTGDLSLAAQLGTNAPKLHATYRYGAAAQSLDLELAVDGLDPTALAPFAPILAPLAQAQMPVSGSATIRFDLAAGRVEGGQLDLGFGSGRIETPMYPGGLSVVQGELHADYAPEKSQLRLRQLALDLGDGTRLVIDGELDGLAPTLVSAGSALPEKLGGTLGVTLTHVPASRFAELWPLGVAKGGKKWSTANLSDGVLDEVAMQLAVAVDPASLAAVFSGAHGTMRFHDMTVDYFHDLPPARKVSGTAALADRRLDFTFTGGQLRALKGTGGTVTVFDLGAPVETMVVDIGIAGPLQDALDIIDTKPLRYAHEAGFDPARIGGKADTQLHFKMPLVNDLKFDMVDYGVKATLTGVSFARAALDRDLTDGNLALELGHAGTHVQGNAKFDGASATVDFNLYFHPGNGPRSRFRVGLTLDEAMRQRLGWISGVGRLSGPIAADLTYALPPSGTRAAARRDVRPDGRAASVREAGWEKPPQVPGLAKLAVDLDGDAVTGVPQVEVKAPGLDSSIAVTLSANQEPCSAGRYPSSGRRRQRYRRGRQPAPRRQLVRRYPRRPARPEP